MAGAARAFSLLGTLEHASIGFSATHKHHRPLMMDTSLHCNDLSCRSLCPDRAVVTTCSHFFCLPCADRLGLSAPKDGRRQCPACASNLDNLDDAVVTSLNPTEDYKTSILSGFSPTVIMECAGRGLSFWNYQMAQEM